MSPVSQRERFEAERLARQAAREMSREQARRAQEDERGRDLLRFAGSAHGRAEFEAYKAKVLARRERSVLKGEIREADIHRIVRRGVTPGGGGGAPAHPFKGINASAGTPRVSVVFGIVNNIIPTIRDAVTGEDVPLDGLTDDPPRPPVLALSYHGPVYLEVVYSDIPPYNIGSASIKAGPMVPNDDSTRGYKLLFTVVLNDGFTDVNAINQGVTSSLDVQRVKCGDVVTYYFTGITS